MSGTITITGVPPLSIVGTYPASTGDTGAALNLSSTFTSPTGNQWADYNIVNVDAPIASSANYICRKTQLTIFGPSNYTGSDIVGLETFAFMEGTGTVASLVATRIASGSISGTITTAVGLSILTGPQGPGTIGSDIALQIQSPSTTALMSSHYGLYIQDQTVGGTKNPNPWAIWVAAGNSYFGGPIIEATFTPASSSAPGITGQLAWDQNYVYVCVNGTAPLWGRTALVTTGW